MDDLQIPLARCTLRAWREADAARLAHIANDRSIWIMASDRFPHPYTRTDADAHIARAASDQAERSFAIVVDDLVMGGISYTPGEGIRRVSAEVGYWLGAEARGRGLASEALQGLVQWIWEHTELQHLRAHVFTYNPESAKVLERAGFTLAYLARKAVIKDGKLVDEWTYQLVREDDTVE